MKYFFEIDGYSFREVLPKNTMKLILLDLQEIAKNSFESIRNETHKTNPDILSINEWESELSFVYKTYLGLFEDFMSFERSYAKKAEFISDDGKIYNFEKIYAEINKIYEKFIFDNL